VIVIDPERETHSLDRLLALHADDQGAVRVLSRLGNLEPSLDLMDGA
jgi:hypothetical protein